MPCPKSANGLGKDPFVFLGLLVHWFTRPRLHDRRLLLPFGSHRGRSARASTRTALSGLVIRWRFACASSHPRSICLCPYGTRWRLVPRRSNRNASHRAFLSTPLDGPKISGIDWGQNPIESHIIWPLLYFIFCCHCGFSDKHKYRHPLPPILSSHLLQAVAFFLKRFFMIINMMKNAQKLRFPVPLLLLLLLTTLGVVNALPVESSSSSEFSEPSFHLRRTLRRTGARFFSATRAAPHARDLQGSAPPTPVPSSLPTMAPSSTPTVPQSAPPSTSPPTPTTLPVSAAPSFSPTQGYTNYSQSWETPSASPSSIVLASWGAERSDPPSSVPSLAPHLKKSKPPRTSRPTLVHRVATPAPICARDQQACQSTSQCCHGPSTPPLSCQWSKCTKCSPLGSRCGWNFNCCSNSCVQGKCVKPGVVAVPAGKPPHKKNNGTKGNKKKNNNKNNKKRKNRRKQRKANW